MLYHQPENSAGNYSYNVYQYKNIRFQYHFHKNLELIYVVSGEVECTINDKTDILRKNEFGLCLSNEIHAYQSRGDSICWVCVFSGDFVHAFEKQSKNKTGEHFKFQCQSHITCYIQEQLFKKNALDVYTLKSCLYAVCGEYCKNNKLVELSTKNDMLIRTITNYISNHFYNKIDLATLAEITGYDHCYISRTFHKMFRMSFTDYLNLYRLEYAVTLLTETEKSITTIAYESGFQSIRNFNYVFQKFMGVTPTKYRKHIQKHK